MPEIVTTVKAKSAYGIKVEGKEDWWNWSQPEYRGQPFNTEVKTGDRVQITYAEKEYPDGVTKTFISTIDKVTTASERETAVLQDDPFSPDTGIGDDRAFPTDAGRGGTSEASAPEVIYGQEIWAKDKLRARTDCIACATGIYKSVIEAGIYKEFPSAETVTKYAAVLEEWAKGA